MIGALANHLWQTTAFAVAIALLALAFRHNQARVRYALWLSASVKFLVPFAFFINLGSHSDWAPAAQNISTPIVAEAIVQMSEPFDSLAIDVAATTTTPSARDWLPTALGSVWLCGAVAVVGSRFRAWRRVRAVLRRSGPLTSGLPTAPPAGLAIRSAPGLLEPGVVGIARPTLLLPDGIAEHLTATQWHAILAHELCHVTRRDNLTAALHMLVETVFWFHPLVWWIGARLIVERERACDEHVLRVVDEPLAYAEGILVVCKRYVEAPVTCMAGISGADLRQRIEGIMFNRVGVQLSMVRKLTLVVATMAAFGVPLVAGMMAAPGRAALQPATDHEYEVASVKPCNSDSIDTRGGRGGGSPGNVPAPNRVSIQCVTLERVVVQAYVTARDLSLDDPKNGGLDDRIKGLPGWARSEQWTIEAKAAGLPERRVLMGAMLRRLLEDRFQLKTHREVSEVPVYHLVVAKGGLKLKPHDPANCAQYDSNAPPRVDGAPPCQGMNVTRSATTMSMNMGNTTLDGLAYTLSRSIDRPIVDKTGVSGGFDVFLKFARDTAALDVQTGSAPAAPSDPGEVSLATALEQFGLKLETSRGPREFLVVDRVERPTRN